MIKQFLENYKIQMSHLTNFMICALSNCKILKIFKFSLYRNLKIQSFFFFDNFHDLCNFLNFRIVEITKFYVFTLWVRLTKTFLKCLFSMFSMYFLYQNNKLWHRYNIENKHLKKVLVSLTHSVLICQI